MRYVFNIKTSSGAVLSFSESSKDDLIAAIYKAHTVDNMLTVDQAIIASDVVEVKYGDADPNMFSWTYGVKKEAPLEED